MAASVDRPEFVVLLRVSRMVVRLSRRWRIVARYTVTAKSDVVKSACWKNLWKRSERRSRGLSLSSECAINCLYSGQGLWT